MFRFRIFVSRANSGGISVRLLLDIEISARFFELYSSPTDSNLLLLKSTISRAIIALKSTLLKFLKEL